MALVLILKSTLVHVLFNGGSLCKLATLAVFISILLSTDQKSSNTLELTDDFAVACHRQILEQGQREVV